MHKISAGIIGTGYYLPEKVLTNFDLEKMVQTNDAWIVERTGIHERRIAADDEPVSALAQRAAEMALADAGITGADLDLIIMATLTSDRIIPATACILQDRLGAVHAAAFDLSAACSGFVYASSIAAQFIESGIYRHVLVIGGETLSRVIDWQDRNTCILFGDGAGAAVFGPSVSPMSTWTARRSSALRPRSWEKLLKHPLHGRGCSVRNSISSYRTKRISVLSNRRRSVFICRWTKLL